MLDNYVMGYAIFKNDNEVINILKAHHMLSTESRV